MKLLLRILSQPESVTVLSINDWDDIIRFARHTHLLGHLFSLMEQHSLWHEVPLKVKDILKGGQVYNSYFRLQARRELRQLGKQLKETDKPVVLLKGAAYIAAELGAYAGRRLSDIDLLVLKSDLSSVEDLLLQGGWQYGEVNDYDQHYYRDWMHEVPPLIHQHRSMEVDLHHNITPPVGRIKLDEKILFNSIIPIDNSPFYILEAKDLFLHSATHLFFNDELRGGLRDVVDMHELSIQFSENKAFWPELVGRSRELGLQMPLYYALTTLHDLLNSPIPQYVMDDILKNKPGFIVDKWMKYLIQRLLAPGNVESMEAPIVKWLLFVRSHWIRMPVHILIPHLIRKSWLSFKVDKTQIHHK